MDPVLLDDIINRLVEVRSARPGQQVQLSEEEIQQLCVVSRDILLSQPNLLELQAPINICGWAYSLACKRCQGKDHWNSYLPGDAINRPKCNSFSLT
ncbi:hypothetical protein COCNU_16G008510 [Cocos nucifera]|uniref:protein-serine/threonine phosphatase n=1 Tax=Cocos nucifera TaxID=13894 RepID=A0A8K0J141_COCNU|nr:hypothetical protein COCNU_16G008510 [Cocos nucifera]